MESLEMTLDNSFKKFFKNKSIFVTGHTGFQGSWLSLWLISLGAKVIGYSLEPPTKPSLFEVLQLEKHITHLIGDVRDFNFLKKMLIKYNPQIIFHFTAQPLVLTSYEKPQETFSTNVLGTMNLLEATRHLSNLKVCIVYTSDKCYANTGHIQHLTEDAPLGGRDPYSASKAAAELVTASYRKSFFNTTESPKIATIRAGNVIGGGDWAENRLVPDCIRALASNKNIKIRNPNFVRPWQYVLEPLSGMLCLAMKMWMNSNYSEAWNFGPDLIDNKMTVSEIAKEIIIKWNSKNRIDSQIIHQIISMKKLI